MQTRATHVVYISKQRVAREWRGEKQVDQIVFRTIDHDELPLAPGRDVFYLLAPRQAQPAFNRDNPRAALRRLSVGRIISVDEMRATVTLQGEGMRVTIPIADVAAVGGEL